MSAVFVFPGQGSQRKGMGAGRFERFPDLTAQADAVLGYSIEELCVRDPDRLLGRTEYTQPALYVVSVLHYLDRIADGARPAVVAGHSLGEYCALFAAGAYDFATGLRLVRRRGELMSRAPGGAMAAVVNLDHRRVAEILDALPHRDIEIANINSRTQCVLSGAAGQLRSPDVAQAYKEAGANFIPLRVSAAFHSRFMREAQAAFADYLAGFDLAELTIPVVANRTARFYPATGYTHLLTEQISNQVKWYESVSWLIDQGHHEFTEIGPGTVLTKLGKQIAEQPLTFAAPAAGPAPRKLVFAYGGFGTQYHGMGARLHATHPGFRAALERCDTAYTAATGTSLLDVVHDTAKRTEPMDDPRTAAAAVFCVSHSLTEALRADGFEPDAVLGHGIGEYAALTAAGALSFDDGLDLVLRTGNLLAGRCPGGMLGVLAPPSLYHDRHDLFGGLSLAAVNYDGHFAVSGRVEELERVRAALDDIRVLAVRLPVRHPFHGGLLDEVVDELAELGRTLRVGEPAVPVYSSVQAGRLRVENEDWAGYLWQVLRGQVRFADLMASSFADPAGHYFVDLTATGSIAACLRHGYGPDVTGTFAIDRFGADDVTYDRLRCDLATFVRGVPALA